MLQNTEHPRERPKNAPGRAKRHEGTEANEPKQITARGRNQALGR